MSDKVDKVLKNSGLMSCLLDVTKKELLTILIERLEKEKMSESFIVRNETVNDCINAVKELFQDKEVPHAQ